MSSKHAQTSANFNKNPFHISPLSIGDAMSISNSMRQDAGSEHGRIKMSNFLEMMQAPNPDALAATGLNTTKAPVKTLFDHGHNKRNKMVIYDDDPRIEAVMKAALDRHQMSLKDHEEFIKKTKDR
jgi:hypothetical protein